MFTYMKRPAKTTSGASAGSAGSPIDGPIRRVAECHLGVGLGNVLVRSDEAAHRLTEEFGGLAVTEGKTVSFSKRALSMSNGKQAVLLGHELTHVAQQTVSGRSVPQMVGSEDELQEATGQSGIQNDEYVPDLGAPEKQQRGKFPEEIGRTDLDKTFEENNVLRERVSNVSDELDIDPGLLAASIFAEYSDTRMWTKTSGRVASKMLGLDDWFAPAMETSIKRVLKQHPDLGFKHSDIEKTGESWDTATEKPGGGEKPRGSLDARKAIVAVAVYHKAQEEVLRNAIDRERTKRIDWPALDDLPADKRITLLRLCFNAGVGRAFKLYKEIAKGSDIPRTGGTQRNPNNPRRTAVLHAARAIHLSQQVFGRAPDEYRP
jgi:hypothetical protein